MYNEIAIQPFKLLFLYNLIPKHNAYAYTFWIAFVFFIIISNPYEFYFLNDDFIHIPKAGQGDFIHNSTLVRPISEFSLWIDYQFWNKNAIGYHLTNIVIHLLNVLLVFFVVRKFYDQVNKKYNINILFVVSTLFLLYSFHSESIYWIIGRGASLCTLFFLLAFYCFLEAKELIDKNSILCLIFFGIGLLTYELIWVFPIITAVFTFLFKQSQKRRLVFGIWFFFIGYLVLKLCITNAIAGTYELRAIGQLNFKGLLYNYNTLFARCFLPPMSNSKLFLFSYLMVILFLGLCLYRRRKNVVFVFFFISFLTCLFPTVALGIDTHDTESERFIYMASVFAVLLLTELIMSLNIKFVFPVFLLISIFFGVFIYKSAKSYKIASAISKSSLNCLPYNVNYQNIFLDNLPTQYKGSLIFRIGFPEALNWIRNISYTKVHTVSTKEITTEIEKLQCIQNISTNNKRSLAKGGDLNINWQEKSINIFKSR